MFDQLIFVAKSILLVDNPPRLRWFAFVGGPFVEVFMKLDDRGDGLITEQHLILMPGSQRLQSGF